jgi:hypothetical protein
MPRGPLIARRHLAGAALGVLAWLVYLYLAANPSVAEVVAGSGPIPMFRRSLSLVTGVFPFSLAELVVIAVLVRQGIGVARGVGTLRRREERVLRVTARGAQRLAHDVGVLVVFFYLLWGFQYARPGFEAHLGISSGGEVGAEELHALAARSVEVTNEAYREVHGSEDSGESTPTPPIRALVPALEEGWVRVQGAYDLPARLSRSFGGPKSFLSSPLVKRLGVAGMHFPYTGEALVLDDLPGALMGKELGHEMAHQRGFASESDANVLGFLVAKEAPDAVVRYAAHGFLQRQLFSALQRVSPEGARELAQKRFPGVQRDLRAIDRYWEPARTQVAAMASQVNDAMLRSHGIPEGVASYAGSTWVFIALARERGDDALF